MCGRYVLEVDAQGLLRSYAAQPAKAFDWDPVFSIAPRTKAPVVREHIDDDGELQRTLEFARWGFKPAWAKEKGPRHRRLLPHRPLLRRGSRPSRGRQRPSDRRPRRGLPPRLLLRPRRSRWLEVRHAARSRTPARRRPVSLSRSRVCPRSGELSSERLSVLLVKPSAVSGVGSGDPRADR